MFRVFFYLLLAVLIISLIRSVIGILGKAISGMVEPSGNPQGGSSREQAGGELKRDPVCGTYISAAASVKKSTGKQVVHFCSTSCRDKYEKAGR